MVALLWERHLASVVLLVGCLSAQSNVVSLTRWKDAEKNDREFNLLQNILRQIQRISLVENTAIFILVETSRSFDILQK